MRTYKTLDEARDDGFEDLCPEHYGGEQIEVKGQVLVRNAETAYSKSEWGQRGFRILRGAEPHAWIINKVSGQIMEYPVYRDDQVVPKRVITEVPPVEVPILAAVWRIYEYAMRYQETASSRACCRSRKERGTAGYWYNQAQQMLDQKSQALHHLVNEGVLTSVGHRRVGMHRWVEVLQGDGYTFYRAAPEPEDTEIEEIEQAESKPVDARKLRLKDAAHTVEKYLENREEVDVYVWPPASPSPNEWLVGRDDDDNGSSASPRPSHPIARLFDRHYDDYGETDHVGAGSWY